MVAILLLNIATMIKLRNSCIVVTPSVNSLVNSNFSLAYIPHYSGVILKHKHVKTLYLIVSELILSAIIKRIFKVWANLFLEMLVK